MSRSTFIPAVLCAISILLLGGCSSVKKVAVNKLADTLSAGGDTFTADEDPELIRDALPFALKTQEMLLAESPQHQGLLLATCKGFTLYSFAFVELEADRLELTSYRAAKAQRRRALKLYQRGQNYCLRAFELRFPGRKDVLLRDPVQALSVAKVDDVPLLQWTALSWGAAISLALDQPEIVVDLPVARALLERALELDESYDRGTLHESMIAVEGLPEAMGGSIERAKFHYDRALALNDGSRAGTYVSWATSISLKTQNRKEFEELLEKALEVDPDRWPSERLTNIIQQQKARLLLDQIDDLFLEDLDDEDWQEDNADDHSGS